MRITHAIFFVAMLISAIAAGQVRTSAAWGGGIARPDGACVGSDCHSDNSCGGTTRQCYQCCLDNCWDCATECQDSCDSTARAAAARSFPGLDFDSLRDPQMAYYVLRADIETRSVIVEDAAIVVDWIFGSSPDIRVQRYALAVAGEMFWRSDTEWTRSRVMTTLRDAMLFGDTRLRLSAWRVIEENDLLSHLVD